MTLAEAVNTRLLTATAVTALVGEGDAARIHWIRRDQGGVLPALVLTQVGGPPEEFSLEGGSDFQESRVQASCLARSYLEARTLADAFAAALMPAADVSGFLFWEVDERERPIDLGGESIAGVFIHEVTQDVVLRHTPAA